MKRLDIQHHYGPVFEISKEAFEEKRHNWHEIVGVADGWAEVEHQDWQDIYANLTANDERNYIAAGYGPAYTIICQLADGTLAFAGGIYPSRNSKIQLGG